MSFIPRTTAPAAGNKYYNTKANGGYSPCIQGNKTTGCWSKNLDVLPNCVGWATGRFNEIGNYGTIKYSFRDNGFGNAEDFYAAAQSMGLQVGQTPKLGAIMVWRKGKTRNSSDGAGHVAIVEKINSSTSVTTSESGWSAKKIFWTQTRAKGTGNWGQSSAYTFLGFIYNPAVVDSNPYTKPTKTLKSGSTGTGVKWVQWQLNSLGYSLTVDGSFGTKTVAAVKAFQKAKGLVVDGYVGPKTLAALQ